MYRALKNAYTKTVGETSIVAIFTGDDWEVYYRKPGYPMCFAFGLPKTHHTAEVMEVAEANMDNYEDLMELQGVM